MHGRIIEISTQPIEGPIEACFFDEETLCCSGIEYVDDMTPGVMAEALQSFKKQTDDVFNWNDESLSFVVKPDAAQLWFKERYARLQKFVAEMELSDFCDPLTASSIRNLTTNRLSGFHVYHGCLYTLDDFMRRCVSSETYYVGGIVAYHI